MATIAFLPHRARPEAVALAKAAIARIEDLGHVARVPTGEGSHGLEPWVVADDDLLPGLDLAVCLGGDGTMLRTIDLVGPSGVPVLGVNAGHLGYLTEVDPDDLDHALDRFLSGRYTLEERMTLAVHVERPEVADAPATGDVVGPATMTAVNEAVVRTGGSHLVRLGVRISGELFTTYAADALIVATPTGSTAYNLSARGPIVSPGLAAILVTPVAAHQLFDRTLVLEPDDEVRIELLDWRTGRLECDGADRGSLSAGDVVVCRRGEWAARVVTFGRRDFRGILRSKFGLADR